MRQLLIPSVALALALAAATACSTTSTAPTDSVPDASTRDGATADGSAAPTSDGSHSDSPTMPDGATCKLVKPYSTKDEDCNACAEQACCKPINNCYLSSDCDDGYVNCLLACVLLPDDAGADGGDGGVAACTAECDLHFALGSAQYKALAACVDGACAALCQ